MGINWKWNDTYTTTTTTGDPIEIKAPAWDIGDKIEINSPIDIGIVGEPKGWICPKCGRAHAPWVDTCPNMMEDKTILTTTKWYNIPSYCQSCPNHPSNGGSGICHCTLGSSIQVTC